MPILQIRLLGDFQLIYDFGILSGFNAPRLQSLLTYLVLHQGVPQARHYLAFMFWPDSSETRALTSLRNLIHTMRHTLPAADQFLRADVSSIVWSADASMTLDVAEFEQAITRAQQAGDDGEARAALARASELYRGDLLPSCYDDWIIPERERLRQKFLQAITQLIALLEAERRFNTALIHAQRLLQLDPLQESTYQLLMRLHAAHGDRANVVRTLHTCETVPGAATTPRTPQLAPSRALSVAPMSPTACS